MSLEQAILDRLEKRNAQIAQLQSTIQALERAADAEREHARQQLAPLIEEKKRLAEQIEIDEKVSRSNREHAEYQIASLTAEVAKIRAEIPLESTREALKNAVAKLQEVTTEKDQMRLQLENIRADLKQALVERDSLGSMAADRALEIRNFMDGHAEDMKAQAELLSKYESLLTKITDLGSYAMTIGRKEGEPLAMFMERQAVRLAALESQGEYSTKVSSQLGERIAHAQKRAMAYETAFMRIKSYRNTDAEQQCSLIHQIIDATEEELGIRLTA